MTDIDNKNQRVICAAYFGNLEVVTLLLQDPRVDPSARNSDAIQWASYNGHLEIVTLLLQDPRVDPSDDNNWTIKYASAKGHLEIVTLLLQDPRVDPSDDNNYAIRWASRNGHLAVVERLLQDSRVDPSADNNYAIRWASRNGRLEIVERLLQDKRVDVHMLDPKKINILSSIERIIAMDLALPFPAYSKLKHFESAVREQRQEFIDIVDERTVYNNTNTRGIHREVWKYIVSKYLE
jgi:ankyrin repeat protein